MTAQEREHLADCLYTIYGTTMRLQSACQYIQDRLPAAPEIRSKKEEILESYRGLFVELQALLAGAAADLDLHLQAASATFQ